MGAIFSKKKALPPSRITEQDRAVLQLKKQRDQLRIFQKKVDREQDKLKELAKSCLKQGNKEKAKLILKKKRRQESLLAKTDQQIENLETLANDIEFSQIQVSVTKGLKAGNESLKKMHQLMKLEDVEKIMEDTQEGIEYQRELDALLAGSFTAEDESEILSELDELLKTSEKIEFPTVPDAKLPEIKQPVEEKVEKIRSQPVAMVAS